MKKKIQRVNWRPYLSNLERGGDQNILKFKDCLNLASSRPQYFLIAQCYGRINSNELEAARKVLRKKLANRRHNKVIVRAKAVFPLTKKPIQSRMGRGKGSKTGDFICFLKPGKTIFEIQTVLRLSRNFLSSLQYASQTKLSLPIILKSAKDFSF